MSAKNEAGLSPYEAAMLEATREQTAVTRALVDAQLEANGLSKRGERLADSNERQIGERLRTRAEDTIAAHAEAGPHRKMPGRIVGAPIAEEVRDPAGVRPYLFDVRCVLFCCGINRLMIANSRTPPPVKRMVWDRRWQNSKVGDLWVTDMLDVDIAPAEAGMRATLQESVNDDVAALREAGQLVQAQERLAQCELVTTPTGYGLAWWRTKFWLELQRKVIGKPFSDIVASGVFVPDPAAAAAAE